MAKPLADDALPRDRLLALYQRLTIDGRPHFQSELARDLNCSSQTVVRLIEAVEQHLGKNAEIERGLDGRRRFYRLRTEAEQKGLGYSYEELRWLAIGRDLAAPILPAGVAERIDHTLASLALQLGEANGGPAAGAPISFHGKGYIDYAPHLPTITALRQAITKRQVCRVSYMPAGKQSARTHRYAPGHILAMSGTLYVQGYRLEEGSLLKDRPTTFSLHRITTINPTGEYFSFDAADAEARRFGLNWHSPKRIHVYIDPRAADYVRDRIWSDDQKIEELGDGGIELAVTTTSEKELNAWVWSFGGLARIVHNQPHAHGESHGRSECHER
jgi:predicted DNA-binding transcriptional regulator YafY